MASIFKRLNSEDVAVTRTPLYEAIPITGTLVSSSVYGSSNIKSYSHGMFQTVYDYPYLSSSANSLFDITIGRSTATETTFPSVIQAAKKKNIYNQMAQVLYGYDVTSSIKKFDDKTQSLVSGSGIENAFILSFSRLLVKDEIKKGSFQMQLGVSTGSTDPFQTTLTISDVSSSTNYYVDSPTGEYGVLAVTAGGANVNSNSGVSYDKAGLIFYQAGVVVLLSSVFARTGSLNTVESDSIWQNEKGYVVHAPQMSGTNGTTIVSGTVQDLFVSASIDGAGNALRNRVKNISFNNTTELNSTIYFCRANHNEFNYSSNPTYLSSSQIVVKNSSVDAPVSYITTVGLYSVDNELLAVAKVSEPLKKTPDDSMILRVRLDV